MPASCLSNIFSIYYWNLCFNYEIKVCGSQNDRCGDIKLLHDKLILCEGSRPHLLPCWRWPFKINWTAQRFFLQYFCVVYNTYNASAGSLRDRETSVGRLVWGSLGWVLSRRVCVITEDSCAARGRSQWLNKPEISLLKIIYNFPLHSFIAIFDYNDIWSCILASSVWTSEPYY